MAKPAVVRRPTEDRRNERAARHPARAATIEDASAAGEFSTHDIVAAANASVKDVKAEITGWVGSLRLVGLSSNRNDIYDGLRHLVAPAIDEAFD